MQDIWFLVTRRHSVLRNPTGLQRWLDFLCVYGLTPHNLHNLLLRADPDLLDNTTLYEVRASSREAMALSMPAVFCAKRAFTHATSCHIFGKSIHPSIHPPMHPSAVIFYAGGSGGGIPQVSGHQRRLPGGASAGPVPTGRCIG
jgi:hypothetical protein